MVLASLTFLGLFLPATLALCWLSERWLPRAKPWLLLAASLLFYALGDLANLSLLLVLIAANYGAGVLIVRTDGRARRRVLAGGVVGNIAVLALYKLHLPGLASATGHTNAITESWLPLGLSFFTLQQITFLVDLAREPGARGTMLPPSRYAAYVAFFPAIASGPILRYRDAEPQWRTITRTASTDEVAKGLSLLVVGLAKVMLVADALGEPVRSLFDAAAEGKALYFQEAWLGAWGSLLYLYANFSGYSDMAIGMALAVGVRLPVNFYSPLKARSITDLLDRWHISLIVFIRSYLFTPVFSSIRRRVPARGAARSLIAWALATSISFLVLAAWHSVSLPFVVSAVLVSTLTVAFQLTSLKRDRRTATEGRFGHWWGRMWVVIGFTLFAILTRVPDLATAGRILRAMADPLTLSVPWWIVNLLPSSLSQYMTIDGALPHSGVDPRLFLTVVVVETLVVFLMPNTVELFRLWNHPGAPAEPAVPRRRLLGFVWVRSVRWALLVGVTLVGALSVVTDGGLRTSLYARY